MEKGFYHFERGYWQTISEPSEEILSKYPVGTIEVPIKPGAGWQFKNNKWEAPTQQWLDETKAAEVRKIRDQKLKFIVDPIVSNPLRWADMTAVQQQRVKDYRQALLDITDQTGFPHNVVWPTEP